MSMPAATTRMIRFVTYNTQFCTGLDGRTDIDRIAREIENADVICLQEIDRHWQRTGMADQASEIAARFPDYYWSYGPGIDVDASYRRPSGELVNRRRQFGNMVLARWPLAMARNHVLPKLGLRTQLSLQRCALEAVVDLPGGACRIMSVHLAHAASSERRLQIARLHEVLRSAPTDGGAWSGREYAREWGLDGLPHASPRSTIVMGDFNVTPEMPEYEDLCGPVDPEHGPIFTQCGLADAWVAVGEERLGGATWQNGSKRRRLDYAFVTADLADLVRAMWVDNEADGSDHKPLWCEINWPSGS